MTATLTLAQLRAVVALLKQRAIPQGEVASKEEARTLTRNDPAGHVWSVGEKYYLLSDIL